MDVMHGRVAELDVHKAMVAACVRVLDHDELGSIDPKS